MYTEALGRLRMRMLSRTTATTTTTVAVDVAPVASSRCPPTHLLAACVIGELRRKETWRSLSALLSLSLSVCLPAG